MCYNGPRNHHNTTQKEGPPMEDEKNMPARGDDSSVIYWNFSINSDFLVVQANDLVGGRQALKLNSAKLIRAAIMQISPEDEELKPYKVTVRKFAQLIGIDASNVYRYAEEITDDILKNPVYIREYRTGAPPRWIKIPWVSFCEYDSNAGILIQLNEKLKPLLIGLRTHFTAYALQDILSMKSVYAIRIYELILSRIVINPIRLEGERVTIPLDELRELCGCTDKYERLSSFKAKVLDMAKREINEKTTYFVDYAFLKKGRSVFAVDFYINPKYQEHIKNRR